MDRGFQRPHLQLNMKQALFGLSIFLSACTSPSVRQAEVSPPAKVRFFETVLQDDDKLRKLICKGAICRYMEIVATGKGLNIRSCSINEDQLFWDKLPSEAVVSTELNAQCEDKIIDSGITAFYIESQDE